MSKRYALRDDPWERIKGLLPGREGHVGGTAQDNRLFVEAVLYRYRAGIPWRDLPERFGAWKAVHTRFSRWAENGVWENLCKHLAADADNAYARIDSIAQHLEAGAGAQDLPVSSAPCAGDAARSGLGNGHHLYSDGAGLRLSRRRGRLVQPPGAGVAGLHHHGGGVLR